MSFYTSLNGLANAQTELSVVSNNLANANTTGFKGSRVNFADIVAGSAYTNPKLLEGIGSRVESIDQNFSSGSIGQTGNATDLAVNGAGFFTIRNPASGQVAYTRNGNFSIDASGYINDSNGSRVQLLPVNASGVVTSTTPQDGQIPPTDAGGGSFVGVTVGQDGTVSASYSDGTINAVGKVALASFISPTGLLQTGTQDWQATGLSGAASYGAPGTIGHGVILSGSLEQSNVDISTELVSLISAQQYFQANSKAISTTSQTITEIMQAVQG